MSKVPVLGYRCQRCGHEWLPRRNSKNPPRVCPHCKSPYWDKPRTKSASSYRKAKPKETRKEE